MATIADKITHEAKINEQLINLLSFMFVITNMKTPASIIIFDACLIASGKK